MKPRIVFMGTPEFAVPSLKKLIQLEYPVVGVVCQPDRPQGRSGSMKKLPVAQLAERHGIPVLQPEKVRSVRFEQDLASLEPELVVTAAYGRILPVNILQLPPLGCINIHASLLPEYRGAAPIQQALIDGRQKTGVTFMLMDEGMDTGDVLRQADLELDQTIDGGQLSEQLAQLGAQILPQVIEDFLAGKIEPRPQDDNKASLAPMLNRDAGLIDWTASARQVHNLVRGTYPWPGAFTWCGKKRLKIHRSQVNTDPELNQLAKNLEPGEICLCGRSEISVVCGDGVLDLIEVQSESGRRMYCRDCAHNYRLGQQMGGEQR